MWDLTNYVLFVVGHSQEGTLDAILEISVFNPLAKLSPPHHDLLELLQLNLFHTLSCVCFNRDRWMMVLACRSYVASSGAMPVPRVIIVWIRVGVGRARVRVEHIRCLLVTPSIILHMLVVRFLVSLALSRVIAGIITVTRVTAGASGVRTTGRAHLARLRIAVSSLLPLSWVVARWMMRGWLLLGFYFSLVDFCLELLLLFNFLCKAELFGEGCSFLVPLVQNHLFLQIFLAVDLLLLKIRLVGEEEVIAQLYASIKRLSGVVMEIFFLGDLPSRTLS